MGFVLDQARSQMRDWANEPDRAAQIARTPGAKELLQQLQHDDVLMQAVVDSRPGMFGPDAGAIKRDMQGSLDYADGRFDGIQNLLAAHEKDPQAVQEAVRNHDMVAIRNYIDHGNTVAPSRESSPTPSSEGSSTVLADAHAENRNNEMADTFGREADTSYTIGDIEKVLGKFDENNGNYGMSDTFGGETQDLSIIEGIEQTAMIVAENAPTIAGGAVVMDAASNLLASVQSFMSNAGAVAENVVELGTHLTSMLQNSNIALFRQMGDSMKGLLSDFAEENDVQTVSEKPDHGADQQVDQQADQQVDQQADQQVEFNSVLIPRDLNTGPGGMG